MQHFLYIWYLSGEFVIKFNITRATYTQFIEQFIGKKQYSSFVKKVGKINIGISVNSFLNEYIFNFSGIFLLKGQ